MALNDSNLVKTDVLLDRPVASNSAETTESADDGVGDSDVSCVADQRVLMGALSTGLTVGAVTDDVTDAADAYEKMESIEGIFEKLDELLAQTDANNHANLKMMGRYFEILAAKDYKEVFAFTKTPVESDFDPFLNRVREDGSVDTLYAIAMYAPHLHYSGEKIEVLKALLHYRVVRIITKIVLLIEKFSKLPAAEKLPEDDVKALHEFCTAISYLNSDDVRKVFRLWRNKDKEKIQGSLHDARVPFRSIRNSAGLFLNADEDPKMAAFANGQLRQSSWLTAMTEAAHVYGEMFAPSAPAPHNTTHLANSIQKSIGLMFRDCGIEDYQITMSIDPRVWNGHKLIVNRTRVLEVFKNLARNAYEAKRHKEICSMKIYVTLDETHPDHVVVQFMDNGVGIPEHIIDKVAVEHVSYTHDKKHPKPFGGSGDGLVSSRLFLEEMGGFFGPIRSCGGDSQYRGAMFSVYLKINEK